MPRGGGVVVPIIADTSGLTRGIATAQGSLLRFGKIAAIAAGAAGIGAVVKTLSIGTREFMDQQKVAAQTSAVLKSTGRVANVTAKQMESLSSALMAKSGVDDEAIQSGQNLLLTFTKVRNETGKGNDVFNQATVAMLDLSVAMGKDLNSSAILVGKALNDPVKGASALSRAGVQLTAQQKDQIKTFVESGRVLDAQKIILKELTTQFGGSAEAAGKTLSGQLNVLKETFNNLAGELAGTFLPTLATAATRLVNFLTEFAKQPTLTAKIRFLVGSIGNVAWTGIQSLYTWWTNQGRAELPARVVLIPSGRQQFDAFFRGLERDAQNAGSRLGGRLVVALVGSFTSEGRSRIGGAVKGFGEALGNAFMFLMRVQGVTAAASFITGFASALNPMRIVDALRYALTDAVGQLISTGTVKDLGDRLVKNFFGRSAKKSLIIRSTITDAVREAVQSARESLAGAAGSLGGLLADIIGQTSPEAKRLAEIRKQQKDENAAREKARLEDAVASAQTDEEMKQANQDLQDFLLEQEAQRLEDSVQQQQKSAQDAIANLTESFNTGLLSANDFANQLNGIIGANRGQELGSAFAGAFSRELQTIINTARDIASVVGQGAPIAPGAGGGVAATLASENERRYKEALDQWQKLRDARKQRATDFRRRPGSDGGSTITAAEEAEIRAIMRQWDTEHPKPVKGFAKGGILMQPTFVAGEAGREAIIPLDSGNAGRILRDALGGGGGGQVINLTVNAGLGTNPDELSRIIVESIKRYEKRNGAVFQGPLVTTAANVSGKTDVTTGATTFNKIRTLRSG